jgi:predicted metal-dependent hydrolase
VTLFDLGQFDREPFERVGPSAHALDPSSHALDPSLHAPDPSAHRATGHPVVEVRVSARRKKTSEARWVGDRIVVSVPAHLSEDTRRTTVDWLVGRLMARHRPQAALDDERLLERAVTLSERYLMGARPASVRWVTNQSARWGSCSFDSRRIRISHRLQSVPAWVLDSVLVHEVAHLSHPDHSPSFHELASRYPRHEEAATFLAGFGLGLAHGQGQGCA